MFSSACEPRPSTLSPFARPSSIASSPKHTAFLRSIKRSPNPSLRSSTPATLEKRLWKAALGPRAVLQSNASRCSEQTDESIFDPLGFDSEEFHGLKSSWKNVLNFFSQIFESTSGARKERASNRGVAGISFYSLTGLIAFYFLMYCGLVFLRVNKKSRTAWLQAN